MKLPHKLMLMGDYSNGKEQRSTVGALQVNINKNNFDRVLSEFSPSLKLIVERVKGPDHSKYLWVSSTFAFAANMVKSSIANGWCVQIRGPQSGGAVANLPIHLYDMGTESQVKIPSEVMIPETREFEFANLVLIPLSYYKNRDYACFFSANSAHKPALYDTPEATANGRINARLPYVFLLSRIAHYLKVI